MPGRGRNIPRAPGDKEAVEYLKSLSLDDVRAMSQMMDDWTGIREPSFVTDEELERYRNDMVTDIRSGPLRGKGAEVATTFDRQVLQAYRERRASQGPSHGSTGVGTRRPAAASSLNYSRFDEIDTDDEDDFQPMPSRGDQLIRGLTVHDDGEITEEEAAAQSLHWMRNATIEQLRDMDRMQAEHSPDGAELHTNRTDDELERLRTIMVRNMTSGRMQNADGTRPSSEDRPAVYWASEMGLPPGIDANMSVFLEQDDAIFRRKVHAITRNHSMRPRFISAEDAKAAARAKATEIFRLYDELKGILARHESRIQKRWAKKTKAQRQKVLLSAWPGMSTRHRPDVHAMNRSTKYGRMDYSASDNDAYMWPHINLEDLLKPKVLPIFLNARGRNGPWMFWEFDLDSINVGHMGCVIDEPFLNAHNMCFRDKHTVDTYGEIISFSCNEEAWELMKDRSVPVGAGLSTLTIQEKILGFLVDCCKDILHDVPVDETLKHEILPEPAPVSTESTQQLDTLAVLTLEAPYRVPSGIDIPRLKAIFSAKRAAAEDNMWALREDPSYFLDALKQAMDHRYEQVRDTAGYPHHHLQHGRDTLIWGPVVSNVVASAEYYMETWTRLCDILADVEAEIEIGKGVPRGQQLPQELAFNLSYLKMFLTHMIRGPLAQLKANFYASPPMRSYVERMNDDTPKAKKSGLGPVEIKNTPSVLKLLRSDTPEAQLIGLVEKLTEENMNGEIYAEKWGISVIVDELGRRIENESRARSLISSHVAQIISDLSVVSEALRQMIAYAGQIFEVPVLPHKDAKGNILHGLTVPWYNLLQDIEGSNPSDFYRLCIPPTDGRFHYPSDKRRSKENHNAMRAAEQTLDAFWRKVDGNLEIQRQAHLEHLKTCSDCCECGTDSATRKLLRQPRYLQRLGEWVEPSATAAEEQRQRNEAARRPLSEIYFDLERRTERTVAKTHKHDHDHFHGHHHRHEHPKAKTRGVSGPSKENVAPAISPPSEHADAQPIFKLDARAVKVFKTIFFNPSVSSTPGEVPWLDFVHAMCATGFHAEKLYGSIWQFSPTKLDVERGIQFHEPHPSGKIPYRTCRNHGRRLNRAYGWTGENFVFADKSDHYRNSR